jgi:predicted transcriptional regulator
MEAVQTANNTPTFESVWAMMQETDRIMKENALEMEKYRKSRKESAERFDREMKELKESQKETDRQMKETDRKISRLGNRIGELIEHFAASNLLEKFKELGYEFTVISRNITIKNKRMEHLAEIDLLIPPPFPTCQYSAKGIVLYNRMN